MIISASNIQKNDQFTMFTFLSEIFLIKTRNLINVTKQQQKPKSKFFEIFLNFKVEVPRIRFKFHDIDDLNHACNVICKIYSLHFLHFEKLQRIFQNDCQSKRYVLSFLVIDLNFTLVFSIHVKAQTFWDISVITFLQQKAQNWVEKKDLSSALVMSLMTSFWPIKRAEMSISTASRQECPPNMDLRPLQDWLI